MPRIFLKPNSPEFDDGKPKTAGRHCDMPGCRSHGEHRAPKDRALSDYYWFCQDHAREYNSAWNFFAGMSDNEVQNHVINSLYGDRPTWRYDINGATEELRRKAWQTYNFTEEEPKRERKIEANTPETQALAIMDLAPPVTLDEIKARYKELVKKHHPDLNRGCTESEELLKTINMAYTILKIAYGQFKELPERA